MAGVLVAIITLVVVMILIPACLLILAHKAVSTRQKSFKMSTEFDDATKTFDDHDVSKDGYLDAEELQKVLVKIGDGALRLCGGRRSAARMASILKEIEDTAAKARVDRRSDQPADTVSSEQFAQWFKSRISLSNTCFDVLCARPFAHQQATYFVRILSAEFVL